MRSSEDKRELTLSQAFEKYGSVEYKNRVGTPFQKIFEIMIYDELYPVYDIGGMNTSMVNGTDAQQPGGLIIQRLTHRQVKERKEN